MEHCPINTIVASLLCVVLGACTNTLDPGGSAEVAGQLPVAVEAALSLEEKYALDVVITNKSKRSITVYAHDLPWRSGKSTTLVLVKRDPFAGTLLRRLNPINDGTPEQAVLEPNASCRGRVFLTEYFPDLPTANRSSDIMVFWSWQLTTTDGLQGTRAGGYLLIPKDQNR
jgi:hypothetical protein